MENHLKDQEEVPDKVIDWIINHKWILLVSSLILLLFITFQCEGDLIRKNLDIYNKTEVESIKASLKDSITKAYEKQKIAYYDSIKVVSQVEVKKAKTEAAKYAKQAEGYKKERTKYAREIASLEQQYADSINTPCKEIIDTYKESQDNLIAENTSLDNEIASLNKIIKQDSIQQDALNKQLLAKENIIKSSSETLIAQENINLELRKQLKKNTNFFRKSLPTVAAGIGFVLGILVAK